MTSFIQSCVSSSFSRNLSWICFGSLGLLFFNSALMLWSLSWSCWLWIYSYLTFCSRLRVHWMIFLAHLRSRSLMSCFFRDSYDFNCLISVSSGLFLGERSQFWVYLFYGLSLSSFLGIRNFMKYFYRLYIQINYCQIISIYSIINPTPPSSPKPPRYLHNCMFLGLKPRFRSSNCPNNPFPLIP